MEELEVDLHTSLILALDGVHSPASAAGRFSPGDNNLVTIVDFEHETP
jgi:urease beta subunit